MTTTAHKKHDRRRKPIELSIECHWTVVDKLTPAQQRACDAFWDSIIGIPIRRDIRPVNLIKEEHNG